ncbi:MAG: tetratricopeptide repeat protein [Planctomycetes bacterium]|nr:tetratricopeptide repeat protein [Planctomycetota bacterium]
MKKFKIAILVIFLVIVAWIAFRYVWVSYYNRGSNYMTSGEYDQAILCFDKAIKIKPKFASAYCNRGTAYYEKGEYDQAIGDFNKALEINPQLAGAHFNRAAAYYQKKEYDKAWEDVYKAQSMDSQIPPDFLEALRDASGRER